MEIPYKVEHRKVKYPRLEFKGLQLLIILPYHMKDPEEIIAKRKAWIERKWNQIQEAIKNTDESEQFMVLGEKYSIENANVEKPIIDCGRKKIVLDPKNPKHRKQVIDQLKRILKEKIVEIVDDYFAKTGFKPKKITIRQQKTKWGSCSSNGNISLNLKLVCLPEEKIRYIVYHEVTHLRHRKHNKAFWQTISEEYPNYKQIEKELLIQWFLTEKLFQKLFKMEDESPKCIISTS
ncbi:MAG: M48 family metallopeptidase [Archaeoglobaceae archaeon]|nr:M48 family metallopeptidase [Archaeoglobaceae archaeon]MDW8118787.1 SprT family zinc-dependent metalloprotease [Archaeoglobaceae archaeon]